MEESHRSLGVIAAAVAQLLLILDEGDEAAHLAISLAWIHQVREDVAVERIDTARCRPGVEGHTWPVSEPRARRSLVS